jgi:hypothetical protein
LAMVGGLRSQLNYSSFLYGKALHRSAMVVARQDTE